MSLRLRTVRATPAASLVFLAAAAAAAAAPGDACPPIDPPAATRVCPAIDAVLPRAAPGLRVFLDRRTGRIRPPTLEEVRALGEAGGRGAEHLEPIEVFVHPDGAWSVDLKGAFESRVVVRRRPDGSLETRCRTGGASTAARK